MRYSVPVNAPEEVGELASAGAGDLYCGYLDSWWVERYGDHDSASRRQGRANLSTPDELEATVRAARSHGLPIHLALNARYTEPQLDHLVELCRRFESWGGTGVILSDLGLLWRLRERSRSGASDLKITSSLLTVAQNSSTLRAFARLGVTRIVFPRFVGWLEAGSILSDTPNMEASVMAFFDKCPLVDGYCRHRHGVSYPDREAGPDDAGARPLYTFDTTYRTHACLGTSCTYLEPYPCAACHLRYFERAGVDTAKIGGRGRPLEERLRALRFLHAAEDLPGDEARIKLYEETFGQRCACYYGPSTQSRSAIEPVETPKTEDGRLRMGSQTSLDQFRSAVTELCQGNVPVCPAGLTLMVPPLSNGSLSAFVATLPMLARNLPEGTHLAVNDLGTLVTLQEALDSNADLPHLDLTLGTLLARLDDPREVAHFLREDENPTRAIWDLEGLPRMLTYAPPTEDLVRHWRTPSATEPSAQEAYAHLTGLSPMPYEFEGTDPNCGSDPLVLVL